MNGYLKLPLAFDLQRMQRELAMLPPEAWIEHFNAGDYEGRWRCAPLRSVDGRADHILPLEGARYAGTAWLDRLPYLRQVIDSFDCEKTSVRLMALAPGAVIREHRDPGTALQQGITRIHVPIETSAACTFRIEGEEVHFSAGQAWYLDASCRHAVENRGPAERVHLMLDCVTNSWLEALFLAAGGELHEPLPPHEQRLLRGREEPHTPGESLRGWLPVTFAAGPGGAPRIGWRHLGAQPLAGAFFEDDLQRQPTALRRVRQTSLDALDAHGDSVAPTAFVFHVSRCGSTLLTQAVATLPDCIALSEPPVLDGFFRFHHRHPERSGGADTLRRLLAALAQRRRGTERHALVKFDSWHLPWLPLVREAFPHTPLLLLFRDPREVLASHRREPGRQMVPGLVDTSRLQPRLAGLAPADLDGFARRMLAAVYEAAVAAAQADPGLQLLDYAELPQALFDDLLPRWGMACDPARLAGMRERLQFHAKHPGRPFVAQPPVAAATPGAGEWGALRCHRQLQALRAAQLREGKMPSSAMM